MNVPQFLEIKSEYTEHLVETLTPYIYEGLTSIYKGSVATAEKTGCGDKILIIFQSNLQKINTWNQQMILDETNRIKQSSNTSDYLDDLIKAVIKTNIILLSYSNQISNVVAQTFYNTLTTQTFIHRCYTECGKDAHNNPYLFYHDVDPMDYKRNQIIIQQHIEEGIARAIRKILPVSLLLKEFLINTVNIVQEPPKVELVGLNNNFNQTNDTNMMNPARQPEMMNQQMSNLNFNNGTLPNFSNNYNVVKQLSENRSIGNNMTDANLEKEVMNMIKSENIKSNGEKIKTLMNLEKILTSVEPKRPIEINTRSPPRALNFNLSKASEDVVVPHLMEKEYNEDNFDMFNSRLGESDRKILNINFENEPSIGMNSANNKSISGTTLTMKGMPARSGPRMDLTSERVDPSRIGVIEDYGNQIGGSQRNKKYHRR